MSVSAYVVGECVAVAARAIRISCCVCSVFGFCVDAYFYLCLPHLMSGCVLLKSSRVWVLL